MSHNLKKIKVNLPGPEQNPMSSYFSAPSFYVNSEQMPEIKHWKVGEKYRLVIEVEQKSKNEREDSIDASFDITAYKHLPKKSIEEMSDSEFAEYESESLVKGELI